MDYGLWNQGREFRSAGGAAGCKREHYSDEQFLHCHHRPNSSNPKPGDVLTDIRNTGVGDPLVSTPSGYTAYGSVGQYFISGYVAPSGAALSSVQLTAVSRRRSCLGSHPRPKATYPIGSTAQIIATARPYYRFINWTNGATGTNDRLTVVLNTNTTIQAVFGALMTTNHPTPYWWLASNGYTNNFENASLLRGTNGMALWQSYTAGLNPNDPNSQLRLTISRRYEQHGPGFQLDHRYRPGVYALVQHESGNRISAPLRSFQIFLQTFASFTSTLNPAPRNAYYRLEARTP